MSPRPVHTVRLRLAALSLALVACSDQLTLPPANLPVTEQQIQLFALTGSQVGKPSAYNMLLIAEVRTDLSADFDFAFDIGTDSSFGVGTTGAQVAVLLPRGALGLPPDGGLQVSTAPFDSILLAPDRGYLDRKAVVIRQGSAVLGASRTQQCNFGFFRPVYAKFRVDSVDVVNRFTSIRVIVDPNCGYRQLSPGIPTR